MTNKITVKYATLAIKMKTNYGCITKFIILIKAWKTFQQLAINVIKYNWILFTAISVIHMDYVSKR